MDHLVGFILVEGKKDSPEELSLRNVIVLIVREVFGEVAMSSADSVVEILDWRFGIVLDWTRVGICIANVLTVRRLTFRFPWMICFMKRTVQCWYFGR